MPTNKTSQQVSKRNGGNDRATLITLVSFFDQRWYESAALSGREKHKGCGTVPDLGAAPCIGARGSQWLGHQPKQALQALQRVFLAKNRGNMAKIEGAAYCAAPLVPRRAGQFSQRGSVFGRAGQTTGREPDAAGRY